MKPGRRKPDKRRGGAGGNFKHFKNLDSLDRRIFLSVFSTYSVRPFYLFFHYDLWVFAIRESAQLF